MTSGRCSRGGSDPVKVYAAYAAAVKHTGQPTVILAKTVKGYGMGEAGEGQMITHQQKKMGLERAAQVPRPLRDSAHRRQSRRNPLSRPSQKAARSRNTCRSVGGSSAGSCRSAGASRQSLEVPELSAFSAQLASTEDREISTTMAFVRILNTLLRDKAIGKFVVPIVPDEFADLRHGGHVPPARHLLAGRPAL